MHGLVLTAAGASTRFGGVMSKVLVELDGKPVLLHALDACRSAAPDLAVVVTASPQDLRLVRTAVPFAFDVVAGGATRQESVMRGLEALPQDVDVVLVHDAARPLVTAALVRAVLDAAIADGAAAAVYPVSDTLHGVERQDGKSLLAPGVDRSKYVRAQTPQAARAQLLRDALRGSEGTDEVTALLAAGVPVTAVQGETTNIKVTTEDDLRIAEALLRARASS